MTIFVRFFPNGPLFPFFLKFKGLYKGTEVAKALSLSPASVSRIVENGGNILGNQKDVAVKIADMEL